MKAKFILVSDENKASAYAALNSACNDDELHELILRPYKGAISRGQRSLYWIWIASIVKADTARIDSQGYTPESLHDILKNKIMARIYMREPIGSMQEQWVEQYELVKGLGATDKDLKQVIAYISTEWANKQQYGEYMTRIDKGYQRAGLYLPHPDDRNYKELQ